MTRVKLHFGAEYAVEAEGHATGSPQLCAAVSCLLYTLAGWLNTTKREQITEMKLEDGNARLAWSGGAGSETAMELMLIGFLSLRETEPERISVEIIDEDEENG